MPLSDSSFFKIRSLTRHDSTVYRSLRNKVFDTSDARFFSDSYEREAQLTEKEWGNWCEETLGHCILGTFDGDDLIGIIMITRQGDETSPVVEWEAAWLDPKFRKMGVGKDLYKHAYQWTKDHGYKYAVGFIRNEYTPSREICMRMGFVHAYVIPNEQWADGSFEDTEALILDVRLNAGKYAKQPIMKRFNEAFPFLNQGLHTPSCPTYAARVRQDVLNIA